jgi:hypothetical protein
MGCIVNETISEPIHQCIDKWTWMMNDILNNVQSEKHFSGACCSFHLFEKCLLEEATTLCATTTGPSTALYIRDVVKDGVSDFMDLACSNAKTLAQCKATTVPMLMVKFEAQLKKGVPPQNTSALFPFLQIATKFEY